MRETKLKDNKLSKKYLYKRCFANSRCSRQKHWLMRSHQQLQNISITINLESIEEIKDFFKY